jgi:outer membrane protein TolC
MTGQARSQFMIGCCGLLVLAGCSTEYYRQSADKETAAVLAQKTPLVPNMDPQFTIETNALLALETLPLHDQATAFLGPEGESERGARVVSLARALEVAVKQSRLYQTRKEQLYLAALGFTGARHQFAPIFSGGGTGTYGVQTEQTVSFIPDPNNPDVVKPVLSENLAEQNRIAGSGQVGVDWLIRDVGRLSVAFTTDFLRFLTGDPRATVASQLGGTFTRPLLRNAGFQAEMENLTQSERDVLYAMRDFVRFRKDFAVQLATAYYGVLGNRDATRNSFLSLQSSRSNAERTRSLAREGRATQTDLGRLEQQLLRTENTWISDVRTYKRALDDFKILLGLPVTTHLILDDRDLAQLKIDHPVISAEDAIRVALVARLDYRNVCDQYQDSQRKVKLAASGLKTQLDLVASGGLDSLQQNHGYPLPDPNRYHYNAGLALNLPLDRLPERNVYRSALIAEQRAARATDQQRDEIELQVRDSWRTLEQARRSYEISALGVKLDERRVEEQELLAQLGRAKAQDQVDTQNDLAASRNAYTQALVAHTIARLQFWNNMGILYIKANGQWEEMKPNAKPK